MGDKQNKLSKQTPEQLYANALQLVEQSQPAEALKLAKQLWSVVQNRGKSEALPALNLLGEISIELGAVDSAREYFQKAVQLDPSGDVPESAGGGAEKFLWLAQLCEEGGNESVKWFELGAKALQTEISSLESGHLTGIDDETLQLLRHEKKRKLANTLCGIVEVYMTDLSWEPDAEARCESLVTQAMAVEDETSSEVLQTLASVRLSQQRNGDAQAALKRSLETWLHLEPEDPAVPDFATKISLSRLLMEAEMNKEAMIVLDRLIQEDDQSVEAWYLGGWCQHLLANHYKAGASHDLSSKGSNNGGDPGSVDENSQRLALSALKGSRKWLQMSLKLYAQQEYEDDRLFAHTQELVTSLDEVLGPAEDGDADEGDDEWEHWEGIDGDDGHEDEGAEEDEEDEDDDGDAKMADS